MTEKQKAVLTAAECMRSIRDNQDRRFFPPQKAVNEFIEAVRAMLNAGEGSVMMTSEEFRELVRGLQLHTREYERAPDGCALEKYHHAIMLKFRALVDAELAESTQPSSAMADFPGSGDTP